MKTFLLSINEEMLIKLVQIRSLSHPKKYADEINLILTYLIKDSVDFEVIEEFVFNHGLAKCYESLSENKFEKQAKKRVEESLLFLLNKKLIKLDENQYYITELGKKNINLQREIWNTDSKIVNMILHPVLSPIMSILLYIALCFSILVMIQWFNSIMLKILLLKVFTLIITTFGIHLSNKLNKLRIIQTILTLSLFFTGIFAIFFTLNAEKTSIDANSEILIIFSLIILILLSVNYFYQLFIGLRNKDLIILSLAHDYPLLMGVFGLLMFIGISSFMNLYYLEIDFICAIIISIFVIGNNIEIIDEGHAKVMLVLLKEGKKTHFDLVNSFEKFSLRFGSTTYLQERGKNFSKEARKQYSILSIEKSIQYYVEKYYIQYDNEYYRLTESGIKEANKTAKGMSFAFRIIKTLLKPEISPILSLLLHLILGIWKLFGFFVIGSVSLLGDGIDSLMDAVSAIVVGIAMRFDQEVKATYLLLVLMLITGFGILIQSIDRLLNPIPLEEENLAIIIAVVSMIVCSLLYFYQRYSGWNNRSIAILAQSEDSKNHVLNAFLVLVAVLATNIDIYIIDGIVGCFIGFIILRSALELYQDIKAMNNGEEVDYDKYKLGMVKSFHKLQKNVLDLWVLKNIYDGKKSTKELLQKFDDDYSPFVIVVDKKDGEKEKYTWNAPHSVDQIESTIEKLYKEGFIDKNLDNEILRLTLKGEKVVRKKTLVK